MNTAKNKVLVSAFTQNQHTLNIGQALWDAEVLRTFHTAAADCFRSASGKAIRAVFGMVLPSVAEKLSKRKPEGFPTEIVTSYWGWELLRLAIQRFRLGEAFKDWTWERSEHEFDRRAARMMSGSQFDTFFGVEHGCLETLRVCQKEGKNSVVAFVSPHHKLMEEILQPEFEHFPELRTPYTKRLERLAVGRNARKDEEASLARCIHTASQFTTDSLARAGFPRKRMTTVPLGCPPVVEQSFVEQSSLKAEASKPCRFLVAGNFSVLKGAHYLIRAWKRLNPGPAAELHVYGYNLLPEQALSALPRNIVFHGPVSRAELFLAYRRASFLVFPTLCDGFGMVTAEALSCGLPVLVTANAGSADLIKNFENGFVIPAKDSDALAERMQWCIEHPEEREEMRRFAVRSAEANNWQTFHRKFLQQTAEILGISWN